MFNSKDLLSVLGSVQQRNDFILSLFIIPQEAEYAVPQHGKLVLAVGSRDAAVPKDAFKVVCFASNGIYITECFCLVYMYYIVCAAKLQK